MTPPPHPPFLTDGEEKSSDFINHNNNDHKTAFLSWTESEVDFGQTNFLQYEPDNDLVKLNAMKDHDWDAVVLYMRKEDLTQSPTSGEFKRPVHARTFVYGKDDKKEGTAKRWHKVPLQIADHHPLQTADHHKTATTTSTTTNTDNDNPGISPSASPPAPGPPVFAPSIRFPLVENAAAIEQRQRQQKAEGGETKQDFEFGGGEIIPSFFSFGEGSNDPVQPLLRNDMQLANRNMEKISNHQHHDTKNNDDEDGDDDDNEKNNDNDGDENYDHNDSDTNGDQEQELGREFVIEEMPTVTEVAEQKQGDDDVPSVSNGSSNDRLNLTRAQTLRVLTYLKRVTELRKKKKREAQKKNINEPGVSPKVNKDSKNKCFRISEEDSDDEILADTNNHPKNEYVEVAKKKTSYDDDQADLLDHACGLRQFCEDNPLALIDDQEIQFEPETLPAAAAALPMLSIEVKESQYEESVMTEPTVVSPKKEPSPEQKDKIRKVMFKLLRHKKKVLAAKTATTAAAAEPVVASVPGHANTSNNNNKEEKKAKEDRIVEMKSPSCCLVGAALKVSEMDGSPLGTNSSSSFVEDRMAEMGYKKVSEVAKTSTTPTAAAVTPSTAGEGTKESDFSTLRMENKKPSKKDPTPTDETDHVVPLKSDKGVVGFPKEGYVQQESENSDTESGIRGVSNSDARPEKDLEKKQSSEITGVEVDVVANRKERRGRFIKSWARKNAATEATPPTTEVEDIIKIETNAAGVTETGLSPLLVITPVPKSGLDVEDESQASQTLLEPQPSSSRDDSKISEDETTSSDKQPFNRPCFPKARVDENALSFDESKVRERVAREHDDIQDENSNSTVVRKRSKRMGLGPWFASRSSSDNKVATKECVIVEVSTEMAGGAQFEEIEVNATDESCSGKSEAAVRPSIFKKVLSRPMAKSPSSEDSDNVVMKHQKPTGHGLRVPAFLSKRPTGINTSYGSKIAKNPSIGSDESFCFATNTESGVVHITPADSDVAVEASLAVGILPEMSQDEEPGSHPMCWAGNTTPRTTQRHIPSSRSPRQLGSPPNDEYSTNYPMSDYTSGGARSPHRSIVSDAVLLAGTGSDGTAMSIEIYANDSGDDLFRAGNFGGNCNFFAVSNESGGGGGGDDDDEHDRTNDDEEEIITIGETSGSPGDSEIIEVAKIRIEADEAHERARQAAKYAAQAARRAAAISRKAQQRSISYYSYNHRSFGNLLKRRKSRLPHHAHSPRDPPARSATVTIDGSEETSEETYAFEASYSTLPPPPPTSPPPSPRRRRSSRSPRKKERPISPVRGTVMSSQSNLKLPTYGPPPPPPPHPRRRRSRLSQKRSERSHQRGERERATYDMPPSYNNEDSTAVTGSSFDSRFSWFKSMVPGSRRRFVSNDSSRYEEHRRLGEGEGSSGSVSVSVSPSIYTKNTDATSVDGGREVTVVEGVYIV